MSGKLLSYSLGPGSGQETKRLKEWSRTFDMKRNLTIIKIGGSVLSYKNRGVARLRKRVVEQIAKELSQYLTSHKESFILVHGAGSFGHPLAKKYGLHNLETKKKDKIGVGLTHSAMHQLSSRISRIFLKNRCPVFCFSPASLAVKNKEEIAEFDCAPLESALKRGLLPLLHGDVVLDQTCGFSILSGDKIVSHLSNVFSCQRVLFLTDVDGIFSDDPKLNRNAIPVAEISREELKRLALGRQSGFDVTGGMQGKISEILKIACDVYVLNGLERGNLAKSLRGKRVGTRVSGAVLKEKKRTT